MTTKKSVWITTDEAAEILEVSRQRVHQIADNKQLKDKYTSEGRKVIRLVTRASVLKYKNAPKQKGGRPAKSKAR